MAGNDVLTQTESGAAIVIAFASCRQLHGSGNIITEKREVDEFKGISAGSAVEVEVKIGSPSSVSVEADDNLMKLVEVRETGGVLKIRLKSNYSISDGHYKVFVTVPELNYIESSGAATVNVVGGLKNIDKIKLHASGAAKIITAADAPQIEAESSGAASIEVSGRTRDFTAKASGGANIKAGELLSENTRAEASGAGNVHVYASVNLKANASGAGNIFYKGEGNVESKASGAGTVKKEE